MQTDGNLVLYHYGTSFWGNDFTKALWDSSAKEEDYGLSQGTYTFVIEGQGKLAIVKNGHNNLVWFKDTSRMRPVRNLELQGDGNLVLYRTTGEPIWSTDTYDFGTGDWGTGRWNSDLEGLNYKDGDSICDVGARHLCPSAVASLMLGRSIRSSIFKGEALRQGQSLRLHDDPRYSLDMQHDCNLVLYGLNRNPIWASGTDDEGTGECMLVFDIRGYL